MKTKSFKSSLLLFLAAFIWGVAFVAQSVGMDYVGPFTFNAVRCFVGSLVLIPVIFWNQKRTAKKVDKDTLHDRPKESILGGISCGILFFYCDFFATNRNFIYFSRKSRIYYRTLYRDRSDSGYLFETKSKFKNLD